MTDLAATTFSSDHVHSLLAKTYPAKVLRWVKRADWKLKPALPLSSLNMARRPGGRDPAKVEAIRQAVRAGKRLDPIVTVRRQDGTHDIADGFHRALAFAKERRSTIPAYVGTGLPERGPWRKAMHANKLNLADPVRQRLIDLALPATARGAGASGVHVGPHHWKHGWIPLTPEAWASHLKHVRGWHAPRVRRADHMGHLRAAHGVTSPTKAVAHHEGFIKARGRKGIATLPSKAHDEQAAHLRDRHGLVGSNLDRIGATELERLHGAEHGLRPATARDRTPGALNTEALRHGRHEHLGGGGTAPKGAEARGGVGGALRDRQAEAARQESEQRRAAVRAAETAGARQRAAQKARADHLARQKPRAEQHVRNREGDGASVLRVHLAGQHQINADNLRATNVKELHAHEHGVAGPATRKAGRDAHVAELERLNRGGGASAHAHTKLAQHMAAKHGHLGGANQRPSELARMHAADHERGGFAKARQQGRNPANHAHGSEAGAPTIGFRERMQRDRQERMGQRQAGGAAQAAAGKERFQGAEAAARGQEKPARAARARGGAGRVGQVKPGKAQLRQEHIDAPARGGGRHNAYQAKRHALRHRDDVIAHLEERHGIVAPKNEAAARRLHAQEHNLSRAPRGGQRAGGVRQRRGMAVGGAFGGQSQPRGNPIKSGAPDVGDKDGIIGEEGRTAEQIANGTDKGAAEYRQLVKDAVASGVKSRTPMGGGGYDATERVTFNNGVQLHMRKMPTQSVLRNGANRGYQGQDYLEREKLANDMARAIGAHSARVETTNIPGIGKVNLQELFDNRGVARDHRDQGVNTQEGRKIGLVDHVLANSDRHAGNWLMATNGAHPIAIDHGFAFNPRYTGSPFIRQHERSYTPADREAVRAALAPFEARMKGLDIGPGDSWDKMQRRIDKIATGNPLGRE